MYRNAYADSYEDGYRTGCYDAGRDYRGLNGHGYDESVHRGDQSFKNGYLPGYRTCWAAESKVTTSVGYSASYGKGYSEGCYDAGRDFKGLNGHGYDESIHKGDQNFKTGYVCGISCLLEHIFRKYECAIFACQEPRFQSCL